MLLNILIFIIILLLYIHIVNQYKKSEDLEIFEMDYSTNEHLQEVCEVKQPVLFHYADVCPEFLTTINSEDLFSENRAFVEPVKVKESADYFTEKSDTIDYVYLPFQSAETLIQTDTNSRYFTENNADFIDDTTAPNLHAAFQQNDTYLKPAYTAQTIYDLWFGSKNAVTPLRYHTYYRQFLCVNSGKIKVKMTPWKSTKLLYTVHDYDAYEFRSPINVWHPQRKYKHEMDKVKFLEFDVLAGSVLFIPPYWWFSIQYSENPQTLVSSFIYNSPMNCLANLPNWVLYYLQQTNTKKIPVGTKVIDLKEGETKQETKQGTNQVTKQGTKTDTPVTQGKPTGGEPVTNDDDLLVI
jgi:Cupin-like domain